MDTIFLSNVPESKGTSAIQKLYAFESLLDSSAGFNRYVLLKVSNDAQILCKLVPQLIASPIFASCDPSVVKHEPNKLIDPLVVKLETVIPKEHVKTVSVADAKRMVVSVVFRDVEHQNVWSKNLTKLAEAVRHLLRLFVVQDNCIVNLKRLKPKQNLNINFILIHKTDCKNNAARTTSDTCIMVIKTMSVIQFYHGEIGLDPQPLFGLISQKNCLKNIIRAARNGCSPICNQVRII